MIRVGAELQETGPPGKDLRNPGKVYSTCTGVLD